MTCEMALLDRELQGEERGRAEERIEMIKNLLAAKTPIKYIVKATGWSENKILQLKNDDHDDSNE